MQQLTQLDEPALAAAALLLGERDPDLARVTAEWGTPPLWQRAPGFPTLVHIILEQQVSLASARAAFERLNELAAPLTPERFLALTPDELRAAGFSRQKTLYSRLVAEAMLSGELDLDGLPGLDDPDVQQALTRIKGIGPWTAGVYLLMVLLRPDAWPAGDRALAVAVSEVKRLPAVPGVAELEQIAETWRPWRAVAARICWHDYLSRRRPAR